MKFKALFASTILSVTACTNNDYIPPESGPVASISYSLNALVDPGLWELGINSALFVYDTVDCVGAKYTGKALGEENIVKIRADSPVTIMARVTYETKNYKKTTYVRDNIMTFHPEAGKSYKVTGDYFFSPLLNKDRTFILPFTLSSSITTDDTGETVKLLERNRRWVEPYGCKRNYSSFANSDYVTKTAKKDTFREME